MSSPNENVMKTLSEMMEANDGKVFEPYIRYLRFPHYKRLQPNSKIDFSFPITALVGPNGCNKSSILHALYGSPDQRSVGHFWFSTDVDRISKSSRHCFIYGYKSLHNNRIVEVIKMRIQKTNNPDYWEPSRPISEYGMERLPEMTDEADPDRVQTRWKAIKKDVLYLDFRHDMPAFDRYFYHLPFKRTKSIQSKQDYIRKYSKYLHTVIDEELDTFALRNVQKVQSNKVLSAEKVSIINYILDKNYTDIQIVEHSFYGGQFAKTVVVTGSGLQYTEAFAGSGESSVIILIDQLLSATDNSLILLDEPETSLHPTAQKRLMDTIAECVKRKHHQVVLSTHSPFLISSLPPEAIKTLMPETDGIQIIHSTYPEEAFGVLGADELAHKNVYVEDRLTDEIVKVFIRRKHPNLKNAISTSPIAGGAETIITRYIYPFSQAGKEDVIFLLDGDKYYKNRFSKNTELRAKIATYFDNDVFDVRKIPDIDNPLLEEIVEEITNIKCGKIICPDGSNGKSNNKQKIQQIKTFLEYWFKHVHFLYALTPEDAIILSLPEEHRRELCLGQHYDETSNIGKSVFEKYTQHDVGTDHISGDDIFYTQRKFINRLDTECPLFNSVESALVSLLSLHQFHQ